MANIHIPDLFKNITDKVSAVFQSRSVDAFKVNFDYGHYLEVTRNLTEKELGNTTKSKRYPLIWLVMDFEEDFGGIDAGFCSLPSLQLIIAVPTKADTTTDKRMQLSFFPRLYPIYEELKTQISNSGYFDVTGPDDIKHKRILRPYWGGQDSNGNGVANLFNDFIDAIQIKNLQLKVNETVCDTFNIISS